MYLTRSPNVSFCGACHGLRLTLSELGRASLTTLGTCIRGRGNWHSNCQLELGAHGRKGRSKQPGIDSVALKAGAAMNCVMKILFTRQHSRLEGVCLGEGILVPHNPGLCEVLECWCKLTLLAGPDEH